jgi:hypothetical protein
LFDGLDVVTHDQFAIWPNATSPAGGDAFGVAEGILSVNS